MFNAVAGFSLRIGLGFNSGLRTHPKGCGYQGITLLQEVSDERQELIPPKPFSLQTVEYKIIIEKKRRRRWI
jgi:hypothetical protein